MSEQRQTYRFGPVERRSLLGPMRAGQAVTFIAGAGIAVTVLDRSPSTTGAVFALCVVIVAALSSTLPVGGRTADQWLPVAMSFGVRLLTRRSLHASPAPRRGAPARGTRVLDPELALPRELSGVSLIEIEGIHGRIGAISERHGRRVTAVLACRAEAFALLDSSAQERRLSLWGSVLAAAANTPIRRLQWIERTAPAQADEMVRWLHDARDPAIPLRGAPIVESYLELIGSGTTVSNAHEVLIALQLDGQRRRGDSVAELGATLHEQLERLARELEAAEIRAMGALGAGALARTLRVAFDPFASAELSALAAVDGRRNGIAVHEAGPLGAREGWDHYRSDGAVHTTYWVAGWPQVEVSPMFLHPLLGGSHTVRTLAVTFEPIAAERSTREVEAAITRDRADSELRRRFGQSETARQRQAQESARRREGELAAGHGEVRLTGFVTVSGRDLDELRIACEDLNQQAARARLSLHRLYGQQAEAFTFTLPLARGLR